MDTPGAKWICRGSAHPLTATFAYYASVCAVLPTPTITITKKGRIYNRFTRWKLTLLPAKSCVNRQCNQSVINRSVIMRYTIPPYREDSQCPLNAKVPTLKQVTLQVLADLTAPALVDDIVRRVLEGYHPISKDPNQARARSFALLRCGRRRVGLSRSQDHRAAAPAMPGICFRVPLGAEDVKSGLLHVHPSFIPFLIDRFNYATARAELKCGMKTIRSYPPALYGSTPNENHVG